MMEADDMFEIDSDSDANASNVPFQQSLYNDARHQMSRNAQGFANYSHPNGFNQNYEAFPGALRSNSHLHDAPLTVPYRFDQPTVIKSDAMANSSTDMGSSTEDESKPKGGDRPFKCDYEGCKKAYKNPGGLKYHSLHGHSLDSGDVEMNKMIDKPYQCTITDCGKRYKNLNGLKVWIFIFCFNHKSII